MTEDFTNQKIIFSEDTEKIISDILKKYNLEETPEQLEEKIFGKNPSELMGAIMLDATLEAIKGDLDKAGLPSLLQKKLNITMPVAKEVARDVEEKLIGISKIISLEEWGEDRLEDTTYDDNSLYESDDQKVIFDVPENTTLDEIIGQILENNGLGEDDVEFLDKYIQDIESRATIIKDAAIITAQKKLPEEKIIELLQKHLEILPPTAKKILHDINQKLVPFAKAESTKSNESGKEKFRENLLEKIRANVNISEPELEEPSLSQSKKPLIIDVEENAKNMEESGQNTIKEEAKIPQQSSIEKTKPDPYKEPIE